MIFAPVGMDGEVIDLVGLHKFTLGLVLLLVRDVLSSLLCYWKSFIFSLEKKTLPKITYDPGFPKLARGVEGVAIVWVKDWVFRQFFI